MIKLKMKNRDFNREAAKISALSSGKFDKYLKGEEMVLFNQR